MNTKRIKQMTDRAKKLSLPKTQGKKKKKKRARVFWKRQAAKYYFFYDLEWPTSKNHSTRMLFSLKKVANVIAFRIVEFMYFNIFDRVP